MSRMKLVIYVFRSRLFRVRVRLEGETCESKQISIPVEFIASNTHERVCANIAGDIFIRDFRNLHICSRRSPKRFPFRGGKVWVCLGARPKRSLCARFFFILRYPWRKRTLPKRGKPAIKKAYHELRVNNCRRKEKIRQRKIASCLRRFSYLFSRCVRT